MIIHVGHRVWDGEVGPTFPDEHVPKDRIVHNVVDQLAEATPDISLDDLVRTWLYTVTNGFAEPAEGQTAGGDPALAYSVSRETRSPVIFDYDPQLHRERFYLAQEKPLLADDAIVGFHVRGYDRRGEDVIVRYDGTTGASLDGAPLKLGLEDPIDKMEEVVLGWISTTGQRPQHPFWSKPYRKHLDDAARSHFRYVMSDHLMNRYDSNKVRAILERENLTPFYMESHLARFGKLRKRQQQELLDLLDHPLGWKRFVRQLRERRFSRAG